MMNRLSSETSPYLRQHAEDPVHWHTWGEAALRESAESRRPILLSIGYAACHWCHVMHQESFVDPEIAEQMNRDFVCIKVDREERPDLDRIYQLAQQVLTQRPGGWPLTMFLSPDQVPFFGGTYFPREARHGLPGFSDLLTRVMAFYRLGEGLEQQSEALRGFFAEQEAGAAPVARLSDSPIRLARDRLEQHFDARCGGFGEAPKFPHPSSIDFLMRRWRATAHHDEPDLKALYMATFTLHRMAQGGVFDQVDGGVYRYSVDARWEIPHFEKMLYDNAQLLPLYAEAAIATGDPDYAATARGIADWMLSEMQVADGLFASSLDADSDGHEGLYYTYDREALRALLAEDYEITASRFGLEQDPNFEGAWHLHGHASIKEVAAETGSDEDQVVAALERTRKVLHELRADRVRPGRDDKALSSWNALAISGLAKAGRLLGEPSWIEAADRALRRLREVSWIDGALLAVHMEGESHSMAYLDDHAFLLDALLELLQCRWRDEDLRWAVDIAEQLLDRFQDAGGGFLFTASDHETLIHRPRPMSDEALPSGNAIAARGLGRLAHLLAEPRYLAAADTTMRRAAAEMGSHPEAFATMLTAMMGELDEAMAGTQMVIIRGGSASEWAASLAMVYAPDRMLFAIDEQASDLPPHIRAMDAAGETRAWICEGTQCSEPVRSLQALTELLGGR
jgi:uncharacterized protein YyaL (SSP411 family)